MNNTEQKLTYLEAQQKALTVKWKLSCCSQGEECWCRVIEPETEEIIVLAKHFNCSIDDLLYKSAKISWVVDDMPVSPVKPPHGKDWVSPVA